MHVKLFEACTSSAKELREQTCQGRFHAVAQSRFVHLRDNKSFGFESFETGTNERCNYCPEINQSMLNNNPMFAQQKP